MRPDSVICEMCPVVVPVPRRGPLPRFCPDCRKVRALQENRARKYTYPPGRLAETQREWHRRNPGKRHEYTVRGKYGITPERYAEMLSEQDGLCAVCRSECSSGRNLGVDHDHACCPGGARSCGNCVRGLVCLACNARLGSLEDVDWMERAVAYLRKYKR